MVGVVLLLLTLPFRSPGTCSLGSAGPLGGHRRHQHGRFCPCVRAQVKFALLGGAEVTANTLLRWYVLHVLFLPFIIVIFMAVHFWRVRKDGGISGPL